MMDRLESIEHARFRALSQLLIDTGGDSHEQGMAAFEDYMKIAFPGTEGKKQKQRDQVLELLKWWVGQGPVKFTPMPSFDKKGTSRMVHRVANVEKGDRSRFYSRLGKHT